MATLSSLIGGSNSIKSIQYVTAVRTSTSQETINVTITSVDTTNTIIQDLNVFGSLGMQYSYKLTSSTNLEVQSYVTEDPAIRIPEYFFAVIEFE